MTLDSAAIDQIVANVLRQLGAEGEGPRRLPPAPAPAGSESATGTGGASGTQGGTAAASDTQGFVGKVSGTQASSIPDRVITAEVLSTRVGGATVAHIGPRAIVTPAAWDLARERKIEIHRAGGTTTVSATTFPGNGSPAGSRSAPASSTLLPLLLIVTHTEAVARLWLDLEGAWRRDLFGCPDDAASRAIGAIRRGETASVVILAQQSHRAACLANRDDAIKAVSATDAADVKGVRKQLRANVWCVDPTGKTWFELRQIVKSIG